MDISQQDSIEALPRKSIFEKISFIAFIITVFLLPLVFIPNTYAPFEITKTTIIAFGVLIASTCLAFVGMKRKTLKIPLHPLIYVMGALILSLIVSGFGSTSIWKSFIGQGFEVGTVSFIGLLFLVSFLTAYFTKKDNDHLLHIYTAILASFLILSIFHVVRFIVGPEFMSFGILTALTASLIGSWYDLGIFAGSILLLSLFGIKFLPTGKGVRALLTFFLILSTAIVFVVNWGLLWIVLGIILLAVALYEYLSSPATGFMKKLPHASIIFIIIAALCLWKGAAIAPLITKTLTIQPMEVSLPWQLTLDIGSETLKDSPVFGAGPNRFGTEYLLSKPLVINSTIFWNTEFLTGSGFIPTTLITQGIVGIVLWVLFLVFLLKSGIKSLRSLIDPQKRFMVVSTFFTTAFFWLVAVVYSPSHTLLFITFVSTGLFIASLLESGAVRYKEIGVEEGSSARKMVKIVSIGLLVLSAAWFVVYAKKVIALTYFKAGIHALSLPEGGGAEAAEKNFNRALMWDTSDVYYQALSEVTIMKITALANTLQAEANGGAKTPNAEAVKSIQDLVTFALESTQKAIGVDPTNYYNYVAEARISEVATSLSIPNAYENAQKAYANALVYNPANPGLYLSLARLEASQNKLDEALKNIGLALQLKQNFIEAIFFLSQIQVSQGKIADAITSVKVATEINPANPLLFFQLGLLYYNDKDYPLARDSFAKAVELNSSYANARYFLGLTLARLGRNPEAIAQFEEVLVTNPDSQEVALIISNLKAGKSPFTDAKPPIDNTPEKRTNLPVKETTNVDTKSKKTP